ncbi:MAG: hypothetical protein GYA24_00940 [Candidatus Lokiarchaeota archaeon]|nr:hypothetical protein [Candidatus Lokiarchaeota archaeon]
MRQKIKGFSESATACEGSIDIKPSKFDPRAELVVKQPLGGLYFVGKMTTGAIDIEREVDVMQLAPFLFKFYDVQHYLVPP